MRRIAPRRQNTARLDVIEERICIKPIQRLSQSY